MKGGMLRRVGPALAAFVLVAVGVLVLANKAKVSSADTEQLQPTVVATAPIPKGTPVDQLASLVGVRQLPADARAQGAVGSLDQLTPGILAADMVTGQQILPSSFAVDPRSDLGKGLVAVSAKLAPAQWTGPMTATGNKVSVYAVGTASAELIASDVIVLDAPDPSSLAPQQETVVTLGVPSADVPRVIGAISGNGIWLVTA